MGVQAANRAAAVELLTTCAASANVKMQVYPARPMTLYPPTGFIDSMSDDLAAFPATSNIYQHTPIVRVTLVWGLFDSAEAADQRDAFVDAFHDTVRADPHAAGARSLLSPRSLEDIPVFNPDWGSENQRETSYYATQVTLEGFATD